MWRSAHNCLTLYCFTLPSDGLQGEDEYDDDFEDMGTDVEECNGVSGLRTSRRMFKGGSAGN